MKPLTPHERLLDASQLALMVFGLEPGTVFVDDENVVTSKPKEKTPFDLERIEKARLKRERKANRR